MNITSKLNLEQQRAIRALKSVGWRHARIAALFDVSRTLVSEQGTDGPPFRKQPRERGE